MNAEDMQAIRDFVAGPKPDVLCVVMAKAAIPELLAMVDALADESLMWELRHDKRNEQLAALTAERDALAAQLAQAQQELASGKPVPSQSENAAAEARIKRIDELYVRYSLGGCYAVSEWPEYAQHEFDRLDKAQREYEAKYC